MKRFLIGVLIQILAIVVLFVLRYLEVPNWVSVTVFLMLMVISSYLILSQFYTSWKEMRDFHIKTEKERRQAQQNFDQQTRQIDELRAQGRHEEAERRSLSYIDELMRETKQS